jgi:hypothetical protein
VLPPLWSARAVTRAVTSCSVSLRIYATVCVEYHRLPLCDSGTRPGLSSGGHPGQVCGSKVICEA